ncbi:MAG TPA: acyltransferase, partial [Acidimicrobiales bacterium]|nr:acyltransferase [Acidimicrobiales bacterium]
MDANAREAQPTVRRISGLDGIRALSVLSIIAFHSGLNSLPGGFYGVDAFFVLSGFLITSLLLREWGDTGTIYLRGFWLRRARRLLPALFLLVAFVGFVMAAFPKLLSTPHAIGVALATIFDVSNWYSLFTGAQYFDLANQPSPLLHTWSLAIEEQFYLVWPLVLLGVLTASLARRSPEAPRWARLRRLVRMPEGQDAAWSRKRRLRVLLVLACAGALASAALMAHDAPHGYSARAYYGTDTRAQAILIGAAIAVALTLWREGSGRVWFTRLASVLGLAGLAGTVALWATTSESSTFSFRGGFMVAGLAAGAMVLGCAVAPRSPLVRLLELPPLPQLGRISYGVYLWYWPVLLLTSAQHLHWGVYRLFAFRVLVTTALAFLSFVL